MVIRSSLFTFVCMADFAQLLTVGDRVAAKDASRECRAQTFVPFGSYCSHCCLFPCWWLDFSFLCLVWFWCSLHCKPSSKSYSPKAGKTNQIHCHHQGHSGPTNTSDDEQPTSKKKSISLPTSTPHPAVNIPSAGPHVRTSTLSLEGALRVGCRWLTPDVWSSTCRCLESLLARLWLLW